jgi:hypothetical protein
VGSVVHTVGWIFCALGWLFAALGSVWIIFLGWQRNIYWGVICFLLPIVQLLYVAGHWEESKDAFYLEIAGLALLAFAAIAGVPGS